MLPSYIMLIDENYLFLFEHKLMVNLLFTVKGGRLQRNFKNIKTLYFIKKGGGWIFIIFCKRVFDATKIILKIKNIELIYFPYYEPQQKTYHVKWQGAIL